MVDFWLVTGAGLVNGLNICAVGLMLTFVGYLLVFGGNKSRDLLVLGGLYLAGVFLSYLIVGIVFYQLAFYLQQSFLALWLPKVIGVMLLGFALVQIKQAFWGGSKGWGEKWFFSFLKKIGRPMAVLLGFVTVGVATPCIMPAYVGVAAVLVRSGFPFWQILAWFLYYNLLFILPMVVVFLFVYKGKSVSLMKEWGHRVEKWGRILLAVLLMVIAVWLLQ